MKIQIFSSNNEPTLQEKVNSYIEPLGDKVVDIKFSSSCSVTWDGGDSSVRSIYDYSVLVITK